VTFFLWKRLWIRALQMVLVLAGSALGLRFHQSNAAEAGGLEFALSVLGETDGADGSRHAVDLGAHPDRSADRYQLAVTPLVPAQVTIEESGPSGERRLYPPAGESGVLAGGRTYPLPGPGAFWGRQGEVRVKVTVVPVRDRSAVAEATPFGARGVDSLALSDGRPQVVASQLYRSDHGGQVELQLH